MKVLDGKAVAAVVRGELKERVGRCARLLGRAPQLTVVIVGDDPASHVYVRNKHKACAAIGMDSVIRSLPGVTTQAELEAVIDELNQDPGVDGILVQLPLPGHLKADRALARLRADKDADALTDESTGRLWTGRALVTPCTPSGIMRILNHYEIKLDGLRAVVVGRSDIVGKPMTCLLTQANATVSLCHSKTRDLRSYTREADLVVVAAGRPWLLGREDFRRDSVVVDVGIHGTGGGQLRGDVRFDELVGHVAAATPVPGGVGPMTITCLLENTVRLAEARVEGSTK